MVSQLLSYSPQIANNSNSPQDPTYLTLHTTRLRNGTQLAAELDFKEYNVTYASLRMSARIHGASGGIAALFTYHNDTAESDIEIPTGGTANELHCSNQPTTDPDTSAPIKGSTFNVSMAKQLPTSTWNNYRLDWLPGRSAWYVNGAQSAATKVNVPGAESMVILNLWSNGGNFSGRMDTGAEAWMDIQWVELLFNTTGSPGTQSGGTVCEVESKLGEPVLKSASPRLDIASSFWWMIGLVSAVSMTACL
jgi:beta-glucanase (GH16 family)